MTVTRRTARTGAPTLIRAALLAAIVAAALLALASPGPRAANAVARDLPAHPKRGIASGHYLASDPAKLARLGATWAYDWSATAPRTTDGLEWVPMVWGAGSVTPAVIAQLRADDHSGRARSLLGFNEPDNAGQSNMSPAQAAALWPALEGTGLRLGSPATATPADGWLARFMALAHARHLRVDFITVHDYQDFTDPGAIAQLHAQLQSLHTRYHRPIWITEIGALDTRPWGEPMLHAPTGTRAVAYLRRLFSMLDGLPYVARYAWFTDNCSDDPACRASTLYDARGRLTATGAAFRSAR